MIVSVENGDFGAVIYLNGKRLELCIYADDETGQVMVYKQTDGEFVVNDKGDEIVIETLTGSVRIEKP